MNLDAVENLSQEDIQKLFNDIVENNDFLSGCSCYYYNNILARGSNHVVWGCEHMYGNGTMAGTIGGCEIQITSKRACIDHCSATGGHFYHAYHWDEGCYCRGTQDLRTWSTCDD